jgi:hypothetical protein
VAGVGTLEHDNMTFTGLCHTPGHGLGISPAATEYDDFDLAVALATLKPDEADDEPGAPAIEIGLDMTSPRREGSGLPSPGCDPGSSPEIDLQLSGSSGQSASPHAQTNSLIVRPVLRSSRLCARCSAAPQRRQFGSLRPTDAVCGEALFAEVVKKPMASRPANDF